MQFFKHYEGASKSVFVQLVEANLGLIGYARWMKLLELACSHFDGESTILTFTKKELAEKLNMKPFNVEKLIQNFIDLDVEKKVIQWPDYSSVMATLPPSQVESNHNPAIIQLESSYNPAITNSLIIIIDMPIIAELKDRDFKRARKDRAETALRIRIKNKNKEKEEEKEKEEQKGPSPSLPFLVSSNPEYSDKAWVVLKEIPKKSLQEIESHYPKDFINDEIVALVNYAAKNPWDQKKYFKLEYITNWLGRGYSKKQSDLNNKKPPKTNLNGQVNVYDRLRAENPYKGEV